jgi:type IV pilus assembly protein PilA
MPMINFLVRRLVHNRERCARESGFTLRESGFTLRESGFTLRESGFTLMELLIVMSIMLILMLIVIPNFSTMKMQANETSAIQSLRAIYEAEIQFQTNYPASGFACSLGALGGDPKTGAPSPQSAQLLQGDLARGQKSGYTFNVVNCTKVTVNNQDMFTGYEVTAVPQAVGKTGHSGFCIDQQGEIKKDLSGGTNCTTTLQ